MTSVPQFKGDRFAELRADALRKKKKEEELSFNYTNGVHGSQYIPGSTDATGKWHPSAMSGVTTKPVYPYVAQTAPTTPDSNLFTKVEFKQDTKETTEVSEQEFTVGNGKTTVFTFPTTENYPAVAVYSRLVEGEGDEQTVTVTERNDVTVSIVQGENISVEFPEAPARRGAVILIG